jgi:hypothetical protein
VGLSYLRAVIDFLHRLAQKRAFVPGMAIAWVLLNLLQSVCTGLFHDEAYYWVFGQHLAWGYAEHAPLIAVLIRLGSELLGGELGVRIFPVLLNGGAIYLLTLMANPQRKWLWFLLLFSMFEVHIGGFFAAPDAPLIFFTTLFFFAYRKYVAKDNWQHSALLALAVIGMAYSKYHGFMILGCTLLSNLALLKKRSFWVIVIVSAIAFAPVLAWLIEQRFATFTFHLLNRVRKPNDGSFTLNYVLNQFLVTGPLIGILVLPAGLQHRVRDQWERALQFSVFGVLIFLFLLSLKSWVEANWSASAVIPLSLLAFFFIQERPGWRKWLIRLGLPSLLIMALFRLNLMVNFLPGFTGVRNEVHGWDGWAQKIDSIAQGDPVIFFNAYKYPAKYEFYTGGETFPLNNYLYHKTQYENWPLEQQMQGREVLFVSSYRFANMDTLFNPTGYLYYYRRIPNFRSYNQVQIEKLSPLDHRFPQDSTLEVRLRFTNQHTYPIDFSANPEMPVHPIGVVFQKGVFHRHFRWKEQVLTQTLNPGESVEVSVEMTLDLEPGTYEWIFSLRTGWLEGAIGGEFEPLEILPK